jgi:large subunit ribosomal protein L23
MATAKTTITKKKKEVAPAVVAASVLLRPRVSEKAAALASVQVKSPVYTFEIGPRANKNQVKQAVSQQYKVTALRVNIINVAGKKIFMRGKVGRRPGLRKAMVYLRPGDKIEIN